MILSLFIITLLSIAFIYCNHVTFAEEVESITSSLLESAKNNDLEGVRLALNDGNENINIVNVNGWTAAAFAASTGNIDILSFLIESGIDLNIANTEGYTPLMIAAAEGNTKMIELLLENNADPTIIGHDESTAVSLAKDVSRRLLNVAIILESSVVYGMMHDLPVLVIKSIQDGAHVNIRSSGGWNPLIYASYYGYKDLVEELVTTYGAELNHVENDGWSALHFATAEGHYEIVELLIHLGIDPNMRNNADKTAVDMAQDEEGYEDIALLLEPVTTSQTA